MATYVDYEFYQDTYGGTAIALADFQALAIRASHEIDHLTFGRAADYIDDADYTEQIKLATCAVADTIQDINTRMGQIQSEKVGPYSVTYTPTPTDSLSAGARMSLAAKRYLARTGLMYKGFNSGEYAGTAADAD
jgi:hypothetical protein